MGKGVRGLIDNLWMGWCLLSLRPLSQARLALSIDQLIALLALDLVLQIASEWWQAPAAAEFNSWSLLYNASSWVLLGLSAWLVTRVLRHPEQLMRVLVGVVALLPFLQLLQWLANLAGESALAFDALPLLVMIVALLALWLAPARLLHFYGVGPWRSLLASLSLLLLWLPVGFSYAPYQGFWLEPYDDSYVEAPSPYAPLDEETLFSLQPQRLENSLEQLKPQRAGVTDLYFLAFAPYAEQDVFLSEINIIRALMERRFDTEGRSLSLVNHRDTFMQQPLATVTNLRLALQALSQVMDPEEDVLVLYLTSHGSRDHELAAEFGQLPLTQLTPSSLSELLEQSGIRWRAVMVSACFAGGYLPTLINDNSFVAVAAAADRTSFGCGNDNDMTYFGNALFREQLSTEFSLATAMEQAQRSILAREQREELTPSQPAFHLGESMADKWQQLAKRLQHQKWLACEPETASPSTAEGASLNPVCDDLNNEAKRLK
ncbi:C13 family peptidase [Aestuariirhabdus sp. Z084]|uniref:C13 family peptidase n=1 Tax=Aestuariirhabdus haliotis TaxID=2918751 RepID=UPI00201B3619|nr:C13 family peptidase [Aestuariirhabdus haliotis]MCL6416577.1 C13 family peptidase [Aestuariirhabdus haliotis]MCL6420556.1 C13 family peptidase [Aestuariirhabdus haliotis]